MATTNPIHYRPHGQSYPDCAKPEVRASLQGEGPKSMTTTDVSTVTCGVCLTRILNVAAKRLRSQRSKTEEG